MTNREIDALVAEAVMGWPQIRSIDPYRWYYEHGGVIVEGQPQKFPRFGNEYGGIPDDWRPSSNIAAAWDLFERLADNGLIGFIKYDALRPEGEDRWTVVFGNHERTDAATAPMAICLAALQAVGHYFRPTPQQLAEAEQRQARTVEGMKGKKE